MEWHDLIAGGDFPWFLRRGSTVLEPAQKHPVGSRASCWDNNAYGDALLLASTSMMEARGVRVPGYDRTAIPMRRLIDQSIGVGGTGSLPRG